MSAITGCVTKLMIGQHRPCAVEDGRAEALLERAAKGTDGINEHEVVRQASAMAEETVALIRLEGGGALLASVALMIQDQRMKVAYLEEVGRLFV